MCHNSHSSAKTKRISSNLILLLVVALSIVFTIGCASTLERETPGVANRGILPLSTNDPFLGANIFLAHEMERSPYLHNFMKTRGAPTAIEIEAPLAGHATMILYYPRDKQVYLSEKLVRPVRGSATQGIFDWIVRGPYAIEREDYRELAALDSSMFGAPVFRLWDREVRFDGGGQSREKLPTSTVAVVPTPPPPVPTPRPKPVAKRSPVAPIITAPQEEPDAALLRRFTQLTLDQRALLLAKGYAERNDAGDVVHTVKYPGETFIAIVRWYTGVDAAADEVAKLNGVTDPGAEVNIGRTIVVPLKRVKQIRQMPVGYK